MEYKFRGKSKCTNQWVIGSYHYCNQKGIMRSRKWGTVMDIIEHEVQFDSHWILVHQTPESPGLDLRETFVPHEVYPESVGPYVNRKDVNDKEIFVGDIIMHGESIRFIEQRGSNYCATRMEKTETILLSFCERPIVMGNLIDNPELTPAKGAVNYNMKDPNLKAEGEVNGAAEANEQVPEQQAAAESAAQDAATGADSEEGSAEG